MYKLELWVECEASNIASYYVYGPALGGDIWSQYSNQSARWLYAVFLIIACLIGFSYSASA